MLIPIANFKSDLQKKVKGVIHIGAHECEERTDYFQQFQLTDNQILWFEANPYIAGSTQQKFPNAKIINACLSDKDDQLVKFNITNNGQSSSFLELKTHKVKYPWIHEVNTLSLHTKTLKSIFVENNFDIQNYNFMNLDIQGAELLALKGADDLLNHIDYIYAEVNIDELYENCARIHEVDNYLSTFGFIRKNTVITEYGWGDALYIKQN